MFRKTDPYITHFDIVDNFIIISERAKKPVNAGFDNIFFGNIFDDF